MNCVMVALCKAFNVKSEDIATWFEQPDNGVHPQEIIDFVINWSALKPVTFYTHYVIDGTQEYRTDIDYTKKVISGNKALLLGESENGVAHCYYWDGSLVDGVKPLEEVYPLISQLIVLM